MGDSQPRLRTVGPRIAVVDTSTARPPPKTVDPFYHSPEYLEWRAIVIDRANGRCQDPLCKAPHRTGIVLFADHIKELKDGGAKYDPANGLARCGSCHTRKTNEARAARMATPSIAAPPF